MTVAEPIKNLQQHLLTYEDYMTEGEINRRYDIIDGDRIYMTQPTDRHQDIAANIFEGFRSFQKSSRRGKSLFAPRDILITRNPLKTRQPDVLFCSNEVLASRLLNDARPYSPAPELVVEVLSPSDTKRVLQSKLADYCSVDVKECWVVRPDSETVEILRLSPSGAESVALYQQGETAQSIAFSGLAMTLEEIFRLED